jgi:hypothetical protein
LRRPVSGTKRPRHSALTPPRSGSQNSRKLVSERVAKVPTLTPQFVPIQIGAQVWLNFFGSVIKIHQCPIASL